MSEQGEDPNDKYGKPGPDHKPQSEADAWATSQNPVRETPVPFTGLRDGGGGAGG